MRWSSTSILFVAAALAACSGDGTGGTAPRVAGAITAVSGGGQTDPVVATLKNPLVVQVTDRTGNPLPGATITWTATVGGGTFDSTTTHTDASGRSQAKWTLGGSVGNQTATASVTGLAPVSFQASARVGSPAAIYFSGDAQIAPARTALAAPLLVLIKDKFGNPVPGAAVNWSVLAGGGSLSAASVPTDSTGQSRVTWTLGPAGAQTAKASAPDSLAHTFSATAM